MISYVNKLGTVRVGGSNPVRIMGILNTSPESFYKKSISIGREKIIDAVSKMEDEGADLLILEVCPQHHIYQQWYQKKPRQIVLLRQLR